MEEEALNVKVVWLLGWRYLNLAGHRKGDEWWFASPDEQKKYLPEAIHDAKPEGARFNVIGGAKGSLPNFVADLNACAEFEKVLTDEQFSVYDGLLGGDEPFVTLRRQRKKVCAPAEQRCRAFVALHEGKK